MIVRGNRSLLKQFSHLADGDIVIGPLISKYLKSNMLIDLLERGIVCLPSALSQTLSASKTAQAFVFREHMLPNTLVIQRRHDLIQALNDYNRCGIGPVVTKDNHRHCGHGVRRWDHVETLYSIAAFNRDAYPFVLQPLVEDSFTDVRFIRVAGYCEAYSRQNRFNFRKNIAAGGESHPFEPTTEQLSLCRDVMERGRFPYAHIDLMILADGSCHLSEIALDGGIKGARVDRQELNRRKAERLEELAAAHTE